MAASLDEIARDNLSGASEILQEVIRFVHEQLLASERTPHHLVYRDLAHSAREILRAHSPMAALFHFCNQILLAAERNMALESFSRHLAELAQEFSRQQIRDEEKAIAHALALLPAPTTVATLSKSSLVLNFLMRAAEKRLLVGVVVLESRPMREGCLLAEQLHRFGVRVHLLVDAAVSHALDRSDLIMIGADAFSSQKLCNKIGTWPLALLAQAHRKPVYCLSTTVKYLPGNIVLPFSDRDHPASEVWNDAPPNVKIHNPYFEWIPIKLVQGIISERGLLRNEDLDQLDQEFPLAQALQDFLEQERGYSPE